MVDFHCHILPGIDDGAKDVEMSLAMLKAEEQSGVGTVVLTPHFYADELSPEEFFERRDKAYNILKSAYDGKIILRLGAEVLYFEGISRTAELSRFCIDGTKTILIEMPFHPWSGTYVNELLSLRGKGYTVVLAHIERYLCRANKRYIQELYDCGIIFQSNAEFFIQRKTRRRAMKMLKKRMISIFGSDCHNLTDRKPNLAQLKKTVREDAFQLAMYNAHNNLKISE